MVMPTHDSYDSDLETYVEPEHPLNIDALVFLKWLVDTGRLQGDTAPDWEN